ncbi:putative peptidase family-domain-containing protein [Dimargaris cristalligena]|uniref:Putative peptidase family-domain-containing protein n=1 Tax=Dimargaris cristalligena TaxID=215637 RepID=A0A4P9ZXN2_9FUNG|nr:putative peptidase family-domain-containing protein [Dimargaris cristalligena]|eukprot:RKP38407.1 putative peptidase family-domain-containing protein [Dimargaris cristalligena]
MPGTDPSPFPSFPNLSLRDAPPSTPHGQPPPQSQTQAPPSQPSPVILSVQEGETVYQRLLLVYGRAGPPHTQFEGRLTVHPPNFPAQFWPVVDTHFKCLVPLEPGQNLIQFEYNGGRTFLTLHYLPRLQNPPLRLAIMVAKDSPLTFDAPPNEQGPGKNDLKAAVAKFRCTAYIWQAFMAEQMFRNGFGRRTFRLEEAWLPETLTNQADFLRNTAEVFIVRSRLTLAEMHEPERAQQYRQTPDTPAPNKESMFQLFAQALDDYGGPFDRDCYVAGLILDSHWDASRHLILAHAALGGGGGHRRTGVFGSHCTHAWPASLEDVPASFLDTTSTDEEILANDAQECGQYWKAANVGMGAFLHEVGHLFTLGHTPSGLMSRGFNNFNRTFMVKEPGFQPITPTDEAGAHWHRLDIIRLRYHPCFRLPTDTLALPASNTPRDTTVYALEDGVFIKNPLGISMVEVWVNDRYRFHLEYTDESAAPRNGPARAPAAILPSPGNPLKLNESNAATPTQLILPYSELQQRGGWSSEDHVTLCAVSVGQQDTKVEDFQDFTSKHSLVIPHYEHLLVLKSAQLGGGQMQNTVPFQAVGPGGFAPLSRGGRSLPPITHLRIYSGWYVDGFIAYLADGSSVQCGQTTGQPMEFPLAPGESLSQMNVNSGGWIDSLEFITTNGRSTGWCGGSRGGTVKVLKPPPGYQWAGIYGSGAQWLDSVGCLYTKM